MELPTTTLQALEWTIGPWSRLEAEWTGLDATALATPGVIGDWSIRDMVAHLGASNRWMAGQLDALRRGLLPDPAACLGHSDAPPPDIDMQSNEDRNTWYQSVRAPWPLAEVQRECAESIAWLIAGISWLPDDAWSQTYTIADYGWVGHLRPWRPGDGNLSFPLGFIVGGYAWHHFADHGAALEAARRAVV